MGIYVQDNLHILYQGPELIEFELQLGMDKAKSIVCLNKNLSKFFYRHDK